MNPEQIAELIEYVRQAADFTRDQAPIFVQELLTWGRVKYGIGVAAFGSSLIASLAWFAVIAKKGKRWVEHETLRMFVTVGAMLGLIVGLCGTIDCGTSLLKVLYAPRVFVLGYLKGLL